MGDLLELSSRIIDAGVADETVNRVTEELSERSLMSKGIYAAAASESEEIGNAGGIS